jgi:glycolate oxidase
LPLDLGGTLTGKHGIGTLKRAWLERGRAGAPRPPAPPVKAPFDPHNILNRGKVI